MKCKYCGKEFKINRNKKFYCSLICRNKGLRTKNGRFKKCPICSNKFYVCLSQLKQKYCSVKCRNEAPSIRVKCICKDCKKIFFVFTKQPYRPPLHCKSCVQKCSKKRHLKTKHYNNRRLVKKIAKCEKCGYNKHVEILGIHHINKDRNDNSEKNLKVLCPNCHSIEHKKHIPHSLDREGE
jgi:hypothetical protein